MIYLLYVSQHHSELCSWIWTTSCFGSDLYTYNVTFAHSKYWKHMWTPGYKTAQMRKKSLKENRKLSLDILRPISTCTYNIFLYDTLSSKTEALLHFSLFLFYIRYKVLTDLMMVLRWCSETTILSVGLN